MSKWIPDRKWFAAGISGVLTFFGLQLLTGWGVVLDEATVAGIVGGVMAIVQYLVPASVSDLLKRADEFLKALGKDEEPAGG